MEEFIGEHSYKKRSLFPFVLLALLVVGSAVIVSRPATRAFQQILGATTGVGLSFSPSSSTTVTQGQQLSVSVLMDTKGAEVTGADLVITYPANNLTIKSVVPSSSLALIKNPTAQDGTIKMTFGSNCTASCTKAKGAGVLVTLKFEATQKTSGSTITFSDKTVTSALATGTDATNRSTMAPLTVVVK